MSRTATLPPIRIAPETRTGLEAVLREGESPTPFIETAIRRAADDRAEQAAAIVRARKALRAADQGKGLMTADDFLAGMQTRAEAARRRIAAAAAARVQPATRGE